ncbi:MAG TPA: isochorismatase family protein [Candidatus Dormibacteraeota bacterium]|nr:isochorismatase family protein [Candidatus Dormibacteraeota bacterium]
MFSRSVIFWDVDAQADFLLPGGKLYVPGAEKLIPNLKRLTDAARQGRVLLVGDGCTHTQDDPEFARFPPHCVRGTPGAEIIPEARVDKAFLVPNRAGVAIPADLSPFQQVFLEKQTLDVFDNPNTETVLERIAKFTDPDAEIYVFGVVTEFCVRLAAKGLLERGRRVALVRDAIETLDPQEGSRAIEELTSLGARLVTTDQALAALDRP